MEENTEQIPLDAMGFLIENTMAVDNFVPAIITDLEAMGEDWTHVKLLDYMYRCEEEGTDITAFQNMAAGALLLLAIERKKKA